jgi:TPR repeat protein
MVTEAEHAFLVAGDQEHIPASYALGLMYLERGDRPKAELWLRKAGQGGNRLASYQLGRLHAAHGVDAETDDLYREAALNGSTLAAYVVGRRQVESGEPTSETGTLPPVSEAERLRRLNAQREHERKALELLEQADV